MTVKFQLYSEGTIYTMWTLSVIGILMALTFLAINIYYRNEP